MNRYEIKVPQGIQYISEWGNYKIPFGEHCIVDKGVTGCGYTEYCLTNNQNIVLCSPRKLLLENKRDQHISDPNILYLENKIDNFSGVKNIKDKIKDHIFNCQGPFGNLPIKFMVTYDSLHYIVDTLSDLRILKEFTFIVDEFQSVFLDSYFKSEVELDFVTSLQKCSNVVYLSATPLMDKYLEKLDIFKNLNFYHLDWSETGYVETIKIKRRQVKSLGEECKKIIESYLRKEFPMTLGLNGKPVESREAVFYFNSVSEIIRIIKKLGLTPENTKIICADIPENVNKLKKIGFTISKVPVPSKGDINSMFMFCTSSIYIGVDMYSDCASSYIFANPNIRSLALDISLDLPQIIGRQRDKSNPFKNDITIFYKTNSSIITREEFDNLQLQRRKSTKNLLDLYTSATNEQKQVYLGKLKSDIQVSQYSRDFVSISKLTNTPVYNPLIEISNERAWEVSQEDYQDNISVTRALENQGYKLSLYQDKDELIVKDFLDNYFYRTGLFDEKMKMYCEFRDRYANDLEIVDILDHKISDQKFKMYYEYFGSKGCKSNKYRESDLNKAWRNVTKEEKLISIINRIFVIGRKYSMVEIKNTLSNIYSSLDIIKKAKATDLGNYFKLTKTKVTLPDKTVVNGFKLESL